MTAQFVVIVGAARSGTKFLRDLISQASNCACVPYDVNFVWKAGHARTRHDALHPDDYSELQGVAIRKALAKMARPRDRGRVSAKYIVEKTVSNCLRVPYIDRVLPNALYIHLLRDGRDVVESVHRVWQQPINLQYALKKMTVAPIRNLRYLHFYGSNALRGFRHGRDVRSWGVRYPGIDADLRTQSLLQVCAKQWHESVRAALTGFECIEPHRKLEIRYEELVGDAATVDRVCEFLHLQDVESLRTHYARCVSPGARGAWKRFPSDEWSDAMHVLQPSLERLGYLATDVASPAPHPGFAEPHLGGVGTPQPNPDHQQPPADASPSSSGERTAA